MSYEVEAIARGHVLFACTVIATSVAHAIDEAKRLSRSTLAPKARRMVRFEVVDA